MTTRSGRSFRAGEMSEQALQDMLQKLIEDRQKREEEIERERLRREEERVLREKEIAEERARREEERLQREREIAEEGRRREREAREKAEEMGAQMEKLMRIVEERSASSSKGASELSVKLVALMERDDSESYLVTFERIMTAHKVDKGRWPHYLAPQLTGKAQLAFAALPVSDSADYDAIKTAVLIRYDINEDSYKNRFRSSKRKEGETNREFGVRMMDSLTKWLKEHKTVDQVHQVLGIEQFLSSLPVEKRLWLVERKPKTCLQAGEWLDEYEQARRQDVRLLKPRDKAPGKESGEGDRDAGPKESQLEYRSPQRQLPRCYNCHKMGHVASRCPKNAATFFGGRAKQSKVKEGHSLVWKTGYVEGREVKDIVLDTGAARTLVRDDLVPRNKFLKKCVAVQCVHGDEVSYPLAKVEVVVDGKSYLVEAAVVKKLPKSVLLGRDVPELVRIGNPEGALAAMTRAQAKRKREEEESELEKEKDSGVNCRSLTPVPETVKEKLLPGPVGPEDDGLVRSTVIEPGQSEDTNPPKDGAVEIIVNDGDLGVDEKDLRELQLEDETLGAVRESAKLPSNAGNYWFYEEDGLLYRHWHPREVGEGLVRPEHSKVDSVKQFQVPTTKSDVRTFLGLTGYYRKFIQEYAEIAAPLTDLTRKNAPNHVQWTAECDSAFNRLKDCLCCEPILRSPDFSLPFVLQTDASGRAIGAVLSQVGGDDEEHPVAYYSRKLLPREEKYSTVEKECLAIILGIQTFRVYLLGRPFVIQTDHRSLEWLDRLKENNGRLTRWSLALQPYQYSVQYRTGQKNGNADALSRYFVDATSESKEEVEGVSGKPASPKGPECNN